MFVSWSVFPWAPAEGEKSCVTMFRRLTDGWPRGPEHGPLPLWLWEDGTRNEIIDCQIIRSCGMSVIRAVSQSGWVIPGGGDGIPRDGEPW